MPGFEITVPGASPAEAAAAIAAVEQFVRDTAPAAPPRGAGGDTLGPWKRAALLDGVSRDPVTWRPLRRPGV